MTQVATKTTRLQTRPGMAAQLRRARLAADLTVIEVGNLLSLFPQRVSAYERAEYPVIAFRLWQYARIYRRPISFFSENPSQTPLALPDFCLLPLPKVEGTTYSPRGYEKEVADFIGHKIREHRKLKNITAKEIGDNTLMISVSQMCKYERRSTRPKQTNTISALDLELIAHFLGLPVDEFYPPLNYHVG